RTRRRRLWGVHTVCPCAGCRAMAYRVFEFMQKENSLIMVLALVVLCGYALCKTVRLKAHAVEGGSTKTAKMQLASPAFNEGGFIPQKFTCDGEDLSPPLLISNVPAKAKELVLILDDPDAPNGNWNHWLFWGINPSTSRIKENEAPKEAIFGNNDFKRQKYGGPCPPSGTHRYFFKLYALDSKLSLPEGSSRDTLLSAIKGHIIEETSLMGKYKKKQ
ncbi:MAG: YbhB/YbcL family Raf kinase inhibitor-like protein, partial [Candidatus Caenarcaniphilales bacterium]|nr:YbhB/YbcL family Raf kinase inhibitor-like protein [Candidatus Caenarcaniphilales bacterium]